MKTNQQISKLVSAFLRSYFAKLEKEMTELGYPMDLVRMSEEVVFEMDGSVRISLEHDLGLCYYDGYNSLVKFCEDLGDAHDLLVEIQNPGCLSVHNA
tara:strand:+ start:700 stop:993 length:294 start_codon:yes stop_codon:yes gene_type:complete